MNIKAKLGTVLMEKILQDVVDDEYLKDEWFSDDEGNSWLEDIPANPYGDNYDPDYIEPEYKPWLWDYRRAVVNVETEGDEIDAECLSWMLMHEYGYFMENDSNHMKAFTLHAFATSMGLEFSDLLDVFALHPSKPSIKGLSKLTDEFQGIEKQVKADMVRDYIAMQKEAYFPLINEDNILTANSKGYLGSIAEFWHTYGALAYTLSENEVSEIRPPTFFLAGLERFKENISDDENILYPLVTYLYNKMADNKDFRDEWEGYFDEYNETLTADPSLKVYSEVGYSALVFADAVIRPLYGRRGGVTSTYENREADFKEFLESDAENIGKFIRKKYYS